MKEIKMLRNEGTYWTWIFDGALYETSEKGNGIFRFYANGNYKKVERSSSICLKDKSYDEALHILNEYFEVDDGRIIGKDCEAE